MIGYLDSIETMGLVDGPGIRFVVFLKGCHLRCLFCHNPETWERKGALEITSEELLKKIVKYRHYYKDGGVTSSGGEPLVQKEFLLDMLKKCKMVNIHTCIDTSGVGNGNYEEILKYTDLVLLDIKSLDPEEYRYITGKDISEFYEFFNTCIKLEKTIWLRQVVIPTINDDEAHMYKLKEFRKKYNNIQKVELLPYHLYGVEKYRKLNLKYPLDVPAMEEEKLKKLEKIVNEAENE